MSSQQVKLFSLEQKGFWGRLCLVGGVVLYLAVLILAPLSALMGSVLSQGFSTFISTMMRPDVIHAFKLTLWMALGAVVVNGFFGLIVAWVMVRHNFWGKSFVNGLIDLPFAVSPVVVGYMLFLLFGRTGWFAGAEQWLGFKILFSYPSMFLATVFVSFPFVVREVMPVLQEVGTDPDQAAYTLGASRWQTFWRVILPSIKWGLIYGLTLTLARALGEFGAVFIVSGAITNHTETATLFIYRAIEERDYAASYSVAMVLAAISFAILFALEYIKKREVKTKG